MNGPSVVSLSRFHRSLAFRFTIVIGMTMLVISAGSTYLASVLEHRALNNAVKNQAAGLADLLAVNVASPLFTFNQNSLHSIAKAFASHARRADPRRRQRDKGNTPGRSER